MTSLVGIVSTRGESGGWIECGPRGQSLNPVGARRGSERIVGHSQIVKKRGCGNDRRDSGRVVGKLELMVRSGLLE
jgi:hypothetical protein